MLVREISVFKIKKDTASTMSSIVGFSETHTQRHNLNEAMPRWARATLNFGYLPKKMKSENLQCWQIATIFLFLLFGSHLEVRLTAKIKKVRFN